MEPLASPQSDSPPDSATLEQFRWTRGRTSHPPDTKQLEKDHIRRQLVLSLYLLRKEKRLQGDTSIQLEIVPDQFKLDSRKSLDV